MMVVTLEMVDGNPNNPGWAELDCEDSLIALSTEARLPLATKGIVVSNQLAGVFGLESIDAQDDIMNSPIGSTLADAEFRDVCNEFAFTQMCDGSLGCGEMKHNSFALLIEVFGAAP